MAGLLMFADTDTAGQPGRTAVNLDARWTFAVVMNLVLALVVIAAALIGVIVTVGLATGGIARVVGAVVVAMVVDTCLVVAIVRVRLVVTLLDRFTVIRNLTLRAICDGDPTLSVDCTIVVMAAVTAIVAVRSPGNVRNTLIRTLAATVRLTLTFVRAFVFVEALLVIVRATDPLTALSRGCIRLVDVLSVLITMRMICVVEPYMAALVVALILATIVVIRPDLQALSAGLQNVIATLMPLINDMITVVVIPVTLALTVDNVAGDITLATNALMTRQLTIVNNGPMHLSLAPTLAMIVPANWFDMDVMLFIVLLTVPATVLMDITITRPVVPRIIAGPDATFVVNVVALVVFRRLVVVVLGSIALLGLIALLS